MYLKKNVKAELITVSWKRPRVDVVSSNMNNFTALSFVYNPLYLVLLLKTKVL